MQVVHVVFPAMRRHVTYPVISVVLTWVFNAASVAAGKDETAELDYTTAAAQAPPTRRRRKDLPSTV
jgi:hypothetical protein